MSEREPFKIYYRACLIFLVILMPALLLLLGIRLYKIFLKGQPAIYPDCQNLGISIGKFFLGSSAFFLVLFILAVVATFVLAYTSSSGAISGVPAGMVAIPGMISLLLAVPFLEFSQINHRKLKAAEIETADSQPREERSK